MLVRTPASPLCGFGPVLIRPSFHTLGWWVVESPPFSSPSSHTSAPGLSQYLTFIYPLLLGILLPSVKCTCGCPGDSAEMQQLPVRVALRYTCRTARVHIFRWGFKTVILPRTSYPVYRRGQSSHLRLRCQWRVHSEVEESTSFDSRCQLPLPSRQYFQNIQMVSGRVLQ